MPAITIGFIWIYVYCIDLIYFIRPPVWNMFCFPYLGKNHPNWLSYFWEGRKHQPAIEHGDGNSEWSHEKWGLFIVMLVYQRGLLIWSTGIHHKIFGGYLIFRVYRRHVTAPAKYESLQKSIWNHRFRAESCKSFAWILLDSCLQHQATPLTQHALKMYAEFVHLCKKRNLVPGLDRQYSKMQTAFFCLVPTDVLKCFFLAPSTDEQQWLNQGILSMCV